MVGVDDPSVRDKILQDPKVQAAIKKAGEDALSDPAVQAEILKVAQEKFPEVASAAKDKILEWANDPQVQAKAYEYAGIAADYAWQSVSQVGDLIEQGPSGVRILAFIGGAAALVQCIWVLTGLFHPVSASMQIPKYVIHLYQAAFAITTVLFEAKPEWIQKVPGLNDYQDMLLNKAKFLAESTGRGLFYGFQGTLWLCFSSLTAPAELLIGLWFMFLAVLYILMGFDIMPQEVAKKMKDVRALVKAPLYDEESPKAAGQGGQEASQKKEPLLAEPSQAAGRQEQAQQGKSASRDPKTPASTQAGKGGCCVLQWEPARADPTCNVLRTWRDS